MRTLIIFSLVWVVLLGESARGQIFDDTTRPVLQTPDSIVQAETRRYVPSYPHLSVNMGAVWEWASYNELKETFHSVEDYYGVPQSGDLAGRSVTAIAGLRLHVSRRFSAWFEGVIGGKPSSGHARRQHFSMSMLVTLLRQRSICMSFGPGIAYQRVRAYRTYSSPTNDGGTMQWVEVDTGPEVGYPLVALIEFRDPERTRQSLYVSAKYVIGGEMKREGLGYLPQGNNITAKASMDAFWLSAGLVVAF
ncbi:MAG: hypothetical protein AB1644_08675 [Candidatus Zixiibacteriota bacterium]